MYTIHSIHAYKVDGIGSKVFFFSITEVYWSAWTESTNEWIEEAIIKTDETLIFFVVIFKHLTQIKHNLLDKY